MVSSCLCSTWTKTKQPTLQKKPSENLVNVIPSLLDINDFHKILIYYMRICLRKPSTSSCDWHATGNLILNNKSYKMIKHSVATGQDLHSTRSGILLQKKNNKKIQKQRKYSFAYQKNSLSKTIEWSFVSKIVKVFLNKNSLKIDYHNSHTTVRSAVT